MRGDECLSTCPPPRARWGNFKISDNALAEFRLAYEQDTGRTGLSDEEISRAANDLLHAMDVMLRCGDTLTLPQED